MGKKALIAASNYWTSPSQVGTHSITKALLKKGWDVAFISEPVSPFHLLKSNDLIKQRFEIYKNGGITDNDNSLWAYVPFSIFTPQNKPFFKSKFVYEKWQNLSSPNIINKVREKNFGNVDLLYFDNSIQSFWLNEIKYKKSVFRVADNYAGYEKYTPYNRVLERRICESVDLVFYTASNLKNYISDFRTRKELFFPNGVDFEHFNTPVKEIPSVYHSIRSPRIVYIGEMEVRFDFEIVKTAAEKLPEFNFVLIGNDEKSKKFFENIPNVHTTGHIPYSELPKYLQHADLGIIPFNIKEHGDLIKFVNPLKIHQYFSAGLPVIASKWEELEKMQTPAKLYDNEEEFVELIKETINEVADKQKLNDFARESDWQKKVDIMLNELELNE